MIPLQGGQDLPLYQQAAIGWLQHFKNTELLQQMLARFYFSEAEIDAYRNRWADWLKPKVGISHDPAGPRGASGRACTKSWNAGNRVLRRFGGIWPTL